jgi:hypothetical protein
MHKQHLSYSNLLSSSTRGPILMPSYQNTMATQRYCGISHSHVVLLRQSGIFLFSSYGLLEAKNARWHQWSHKVKTKTTWFDKMASWPPYEVQNWHTNVTQKWTFAMSSGNFLTCKKICDCWRSCCRSLKNLAGGHTKAQDGLRNGPVLLQSDPNLNISLFVCPSGANFGTVRRQHLGNW